MKLVQKVDDIFGKISPPPGISSSMALDPVAGLGKFLGTVVNLVIVASGLFMLIYLLWGAFDWIASGGEKERVEKARNKITNALIGMLLIFVVLTIFGVFTGEILGIIKISNRVWQIQIPHL